jgi:MFS family permease
VRTIRAALLLCIIGAGSGLLSAVIAPTLTLMAPALGDGQKGIFLAQMVMMSASLALAASATLVGWLSERIGYGLAMIIGIVGFAVFGCVGAFSESLWILAASRVLAGICAAAMVAPACALIFYYFDGKVRERVFGLMTAASATFATVGSAISGFLVRDFGWHSAYLIYAGAVIPSLIVPLVITDKNGSGGAIRPPPMPKGEPLPMASICGLLLFTMFMAMLMLNCVVQLPFMLVERHHSDPRLVSVVLAVETSLQIVGAMLFGWFSTRFSLRQMMSMILLIFGIGHLTVGLSTTLSMILVGIGVIGFGSAFTKPVAASHLLKTLPPAMHGRASGAIVTALYLGAFLNPVLITPVAAQIGSFPSFVLIGIVNVIAFFIAIVPLRYHVVGSR